MMSETYTPRTSKSKQLGATLFLGATKMNRRLVPLFMLFTAVAFLAMPIGAEDWNAFRGPRGDGVSTDTGFAQQWGPEKNIRWKAALPGPGNGSPIVSAGKVFVTCAQDPSEGKQRSLYCFDRKTGKELWVRTVDFDKVMPTHKTNPYCATTPACDGERVVVWHGSAGVFCYDLDGKQLWSRNLGEFEHIWGYASSPVIDGDRVYLNCGPGKRVFVTALDRKSGETLWENGEPGEGDGQRNDAGKYMGSWSTPIVTTVDGQKQVICSLPTRVIGYDPASGKVLWYCKGLRGAKGDLSYSSPVIAGDICIATGGFGGPAIGFELGGKGDITDAARLWRREKNPQSIGTGVAVDGFLYRPNAGPGTIECLDIKTGETVWQDRAAGANHWGSVVQAEGLLYIANQKGTTLVFKPNPEKYEQVAQNELDEPSNSTPAFSDGDIFLRTFGHLYSISP
jgi:outer membrane protein assembly factor BamB